MRADVPLPTRYDHNIPMFDTQGNITARVRDGLENVLSVYTQCAQLQARETDNNPSNYQIKHVYIVGSGARTNKVDSDMDLLFRVPALDKTSYKTLKVMLAVIFYTDRPKEEAIDVFFEKEEDYPDKEKTEITDQVEELLKKCNQILTGKNHTKNL